MIKLNKKNYSIEETETEFIIIGIPDIHNLKKDSFDYTLIFKLRQEYCQLSNLFEIELISSSREQEITLARHCIVYFIKQNSKLSLKAIGTFFNCRDHSTILHSIGEVVNCLSFSCKEKTICEDYLKILESIWKRITNNKELK